MMWPDVPELDRQAAYRSLSIRIAQLPAGSRAFKDSIAMLNTLTDAADDGALWTEKRLADELRNAS